MIFFIVFFATLLLHPFLWAGGFEGPGVGPRALAMGGAYVAVADDWTAGYWNPAGLAFLKGFGGGESVDFLGVRAFDSGSIANPVAPLTQSQIEQGVPFTQFGGEPTHFNVTDATIQTALPSLGVYKAWESWAIGAGVFAPLGFAYTLHDTTVPGIQAAYKSQGYILVYNFSVAHQWNDRWSIGAGVNWLDGRVEREASKLTSTYFYNASADGRGQAVQGVFGVLGKLTHRLSFGAAYKTAEDIPLDGTAVVTDTQFPLSLPGGGTLTNESSREQVAVRNPATYQAGFAFSPTPASTLTTDWEGTDWRGTRTNSLFDQPGAILQNEDFDADWRFTNRIRVGGEYRWTLAPKKSFALRGGYMWDPYAIPDQGVSLTNIDDVSRHFFTAGMGWKFGAWEPDISFEYAFGSRSVGDTEYKQVARLLSIGLRYHL